jgi:hypothetical protein
MRRSQPERRLFHGSELRRFATMLLLLVMLFFLIPLIRNQPGMFSFLSAVTQEGAPATGPQGAGAGLAAQGKGPQAEESKTKESTSAPNAPAEAPAPGPVSEDERAQAQLKDWLGIVTDKSLQMHPRENPAYYRLLKMAKEQTAEQMQQKARRDRRFNDFYTSAAAHRGELVQIELNVRRIVSFPVEEANEAEVAQLYELWGWSEEAKAWLYVAVTPELPDGMPTGTTVEERVTFLGYFFKLQGYHEAGAKPNARPLFAPLLIGRLIWHPAPVRESRDPAWMWYVLAGAVVVIAGIIVVRVFGGRRGRSTIAEKSRQTPPPAWLQQPMTDAESHGSDKATERGKATGDTSPPPST